MSFRDRLSLPQRVVIVVALGLASTVLQWWLLADHAVRGGWFSYAPNSGLEYTRPERFSPAAIALGSLVLLGAWCAASVWLLHVAPSRRVDEDTEHI